MSDTSAAVHIAQILESQLSYTIGTDLWVSREPTSPNDVVTVYDTPSEAPSNVMTGDARYEYLMVQIIVRREGMRDAMNDLYDIIGVLDFRTGDVKDGYTYSGIILQNTGIIDYDDNRRCRVTANFRVQRY